MYNFFAQNRDDDRFIIDGADFNHIKNVLRMKEGDEFLISFEGQSHLCTLSQIFSDYLIAQIIEENYRETELPIKIYLFQGLPKGDKMELIIQKCAELGVFKIIPVEMKRCVVKLDDKKKKSKRERWQAISESAAKQSKRNIVPEICDVLSFEDALKMAKELDILLVPYENKDGMKATKEALSKIKSGNSVGIFIGAEGGFDDCEIEKAIEMGGISVSLGKRILRTETAAVTSLSMCMLYAEMNLSGENK